MYPNQGLGTSSQATELRRKLEHFLHGLTCGAGGTGPARGPDPGWPFTDRQHAAKLAEPLKLTNIKHLSSADQAPLAALSPIGGCQGASGALSPHLVTCMKVEEEVLAKRRKLNNGSVLGHVVSQLGLGIACCSRWAANRR